MVVPLKKKKDIVKLSEEGASNKEIAETFEVAEGTVGRIIKKAKGFNPQALEEPKDTLQGGGSFVLPQKEKRSLDIADRTFHLSPETLILIRDLVDKGIAIDMDDAVNKAIGLLRYQIDSNKQDSQVKQEPKPEDMLGSIQDIANIQKAVATMKALNKFLGDSDMSMKDLMMWRFMSKEDRPPQSITPELLIALLTKSGNQDNAGLQQQIMNLQNQLTQVSTKGQSIDPLVLTLLMSSNKSLPDVLSAVEKSRTIDEATRQKYQLALEGFRQDKEDLRDKFYEEKSRQTENLIRELKDKIERAGEKSGLDKAVTEELVGSVATAVIDQAKRGIKAAQGDKSRDEIIGDIAKTGLEAFRPVISQYAELQRTAALERAQAQQRAMIDQHKSAQVAASSETAAPAQGKPVILTDETRSGVGEGGYFPGEQRYK